MITQMMNVTLTSSSASLPFFVTQSLTTIYYFVKYPILWYNITTNILNMTQTTQPKKRRKNNFIDNKEFYAAMLEYEKLKLMLEKGLERKDWPQISRYIGKCFLDIAEHLSMRPNFSNYVYRQDMVWMPLKNCVIIS